MAQRIEMRYGMAVGRCREIVGTIGAAARVVANLLHQSLWGGIVGRVLSRQRKCERDGLASPDQAGRRSATGSRDEI
jgi:hypothetical protein